MVMKIPKDKVSKEDIAEWTLALYEMIESQVDMTEAELEQLCFDAVEMTIEKHFGYPDYRNYN